MSSLVYVSGSDDSLSQLHILVSASLDSSMTGLLLLPLRRPGLLIG